MSSDPSVKTEKVAAKDESKDDEKKTDLDVIVGAAKSVLKKIKRNVPHTSLSREIAFSRVGRKFNIKRSIGAHPLPQEIEKVFDYDPEWFIGHLSGTWYGNSGIDTVFVPLLKEPSGNGGDFNTGFSTSYEETIICTKLDGFILNPVQTSKEFPAGIFIGAELLFGVRYTKVVTSTQELEDGGTNPFLKGTQIHDETGYILFSYKGKKGDNDKSIKCDLTRIIHSFTIPRGVTVNSNCDVKNADINQDNGTLDYTVLAGVLAGTLNPNAFAWTVASGQHFFDVPAPAPIGNHGGTGKVDGTDLKNEFKFVNGGIGSTWKYKQRAPFHFPVPWEHDNSNTLQKTSN